MFSRFRSRFRRWLIAGAVLRIVCAATPVAAGVVSSFAEMEEVGARVSNREASSVGAALPGTSETGAAKQGHGLASFAATGAPFLQNGTLDGMAFVLPEQPSADAIEAYLALMGHFGRVSGISGLRAEVVPASQVGRVADRHLIVIGDTESNPLVSAWERHQSVRRDGNRVQVVMAGSVLARLLRAPDARTVALEGRGRMLARASVGAPQAWLAAFVSPLDARRVVVMLGTSGGARLTRVTSDIVDPATRPGVRGDYFLKTSTDSAFHVSGRTQVSDVPRIPAVDKWYAVPLGLLILVTGFGLLIMVLAAVAQVVHHCLRPAEASMSSSGWMLPTSQSAKRFAQ